MWHMYYTHQFFPSPPRLPFLLFYFLISNPSYISLLILSNDCPRSFHFDTRSLENKQNIHCVTSVNEGLCARPFICVFITSHLIYYP